MCMCVQVEAFLAGCCNGWEFDAFKLDEVTQGHGLSTLGFYLMHEAGLMRRFKISPNALARCVCLCCSPRAVPAHAQTIRWR